MRRIVSFAVAWLTAAVVALVVASQGVAFVGQQVTTDRPAPLSAADLEASIANANDTTATTPEAAPSTTVVDPGPSTTSSPGSTVTSPAPPTGPSGPQGSSGQTTTPTTQSTAPSTPTDSTAPQSTSTSSTTTPQSGSSTSKTSPTTSTTQAPQPAASTRTYNLTGGSVSLRFASTGVTVNYATPKAGFEVNIEPEHGNGVKVEFRSDTHRSRVDGWWENGPVDRIREEAD